MNFSAYVFRPKYELKTIWKTNITSISSIKIIIVNEEHKNKVFVFDQASEQSTFTSNIHDIASSFYSVRIIVIDKCKREFNNICFIKEGPPIIPQEDASKCSEAYFIDNGEDKGDCTGKHQGVDTEKPEDVDTEKNQGDDTDQHQGGDTQNPVDDTEEHEGFDTGKNQCDEINQGNIVIGTKIVSKYSIVF